MAYAHPNQEFHDRVGRHGRRRVDLSFARHFVGIFALTFSGAVFFTVAHFLFRI